MGHGRVCGVNLEFLDGNLDIKREGKRPLDVSMHVTDLASSSRILNCVLYPTIKGGPDDSLLPIVPHLLDTIKVTHRYAGGRRKEMSVPWSCTSVTNTLHSILETT
jgi:hypothetical protein